MAQLSWAWFPWSRVDPCCHRSDNARRVIPSACLMRQWRHWHSGARRSGWPAITNWMKTEILLTSTEIGSRWRPRGNTSRFCAWNQMSTFIASRRGRRIADTGELKDARARGHGRCLCCINDVSMFRLLFLDCVRVIMIHLRGVYIVCLLSRGYFKDAMQCNGSSLKMLISEKNIRWFQTLGLFHCELTTWC